MNKLTRNNIAYDLNISPHEVKVSYSDAAIKYMFSSQLYAEKFSMKLKENREKINQSLSNRFGFKITNDKLADLKLYITIEKRGFLIYQDGTKIECLNTVQLDGDNLMMLN